MTDISVKDSVKQDKTARNRISISYIKRLLGNEILEKWKDMWGNPDTKGRFTRKLPKVSTRIVWLGHWLTQLLTNHEVVL